MRRLAQYSVTFGVIFAAAFGAVRAARGQPPDQAGPVILAQETQDANLREITADNASSLGEAPQAPNIGFIDSPSATCYKPEPAGDTCYVSWYYLYVDANPNYMITMTLTINAVGPVAHTQGFFQTSMYVPYNMMGQGFRVSCGALGAGGNPGLGNAYAYTIRARDSAALSSANYGTVYCPAGSP
jgi:hypothetical protein